MDLVHRGVAGGEHDDRQFWRLRSFKTPTPTGFGSMMSNRTSSGPKRLASSRLETPSWAHRTLKSGRSSSGSTKSAIERSSSSSSTRVTDIICSCLSFQSILCCPEPLHERCPLSPNVPVPLAGSQYQRYIRYRCITESTLLSCGSLVKGRQQPDTQSPTRLAKIEANKRAVCSEVLQQSPAPNL